jgi:hypothetical protein
MNPAFHELRPRAPWGDYGDILVSGLYRRDPSTGCLHLHRAGPFLPPISFPFCSPDRAVVVSDRLRRDLETSPLPGLAFRRAIAAHIVPIAWESWDWNAPLPPHRAPGGEPESYLLGRGHSPEAAGKMEPAWELVCPVIPCVRASWLRDGPEDRSAPPALLLGDARYEGLFLPAPGCLPVADEAAAAWIEARAPDWVEMAPLAVEHDPGALEAIRARRREAEDAAPHLGSDQYRSLLEAFCARNGYAVPHAIHRAGQSIGRYCVVLLDAAPPKVSAMTYNSPASVADYLDHRRRTAPPRADVLATTLVFDLEKGRSLTPGELVRRDAPT